MFTGIIEELGLLKSRQGSLRGGAGLTVKAQLALEDLKIGDSIAVNGACLTVTGFTRDTFTAHVMPETLRKTTLFKVAPGCRLNLERAMALGDRLGGHLVSGHVDGTGTLISRLNEGNAIILKFQASPDLTRYIIPRGSIAVEGVSLTAAFVDKDGFSVSLIPHTASITTLGSLKQGDTVNIETDLIGKYVEKLLQSYKREKEQDEVKEKITASFLQDNGFI